MSAQEFEIIMAKLYTDQAYLERFIRNPREVLNQTCLMDNQIQALMNLDKAGLILAHRSYKRKREKCPGQGVSFRSFFQRLMTWFGRPA